jgi:ribonuclease HI
METPMEYKAYVSGIAGEKGPGYVSVAFLVIDSDNNEVLRDFHDINTWGSPHDAEYKAVIHLLEKLTGHPEIQKLSILTSSTFVANQVTGKWRINVDRHKGFCQSVIGKCIGRLANYGVSSVLTYIPKIENLVKEWHWERHLEAREAATETETTEV